VHGIVTGHGGTIAVRSEPGEGSEFTLSLPRSANITRRGKLKPQRPEQAKSLCNGNRESALDGPGIASLSDYSAARVSRWASGAMPSARL